jgi:ribosomal-protein-serine acetyltransferase
MKGVERLQPAGLRQLRGADAEELYAVVDANREHLARWLPWAAGQDLSGTRRFLAENEAQLARNAGFQAALVPDARIVGVAGFHAVDWNNRHTSIGYWLAEEAQGSGLMTAAVTTLIDLAFEGWGLHRIEIHAAPENHRSRAIPERLGFREEGLLRDAELVGGRWLDGVVYGLLEAEWEAGRSQA